MESFIFSYLSNLLDKSWPRVRDVTVSSLNVLKSSRIFGKVSRDSWDDDKEMPEIFVSAGPTRDERTRDVWVNSVGNQPVCLGERFVLPYNQIFMKLVRFPFAHIVPKGTKWKFNNSSDGSFMKFFDRKDGKVKECQLVKGNYIYINCKKRNFMKKCYEFLFCNEHHDREL